ncbi:F-box protein At3g59000-like isoform X2 [Brassica rapa]|uniref:F-box protein At3g59000-like isoform X2 n=1 Tax=Brassica campestris TaxID=3711 RepID=UPI00142E1935|nr:F-box protein At3g59000-like isoform X2 [Brassica rapa]
MDRVSNLPDEVLSHILSLLTTKEAALTSILSKRWRNLLAFVPSLTIDDSVFLHPEEGKQDRVEVKQSFMDFVDRVLALQGNSPLNKFSLKCVTVVDTDRVDGWVSNALARGGVSDLDLQIIIPSDIGEFYKLSPKCFECNTLVSLKIHRGIDISLVAGRILLPLLKTLVLDSVPVCPNEFEILLQALPSLEELVLVYVMWKGRDVIVSSASVKTLIVNLGFWLNTLSFDTPSLVHFGYSGSAAWDYPVVNMGNLVDTQIDFYLSQLHIKLLGAPGNDEDALPYSNAWKLFHGIRNVSHLSLFPDALEVLSMCSESLPVFNNLNSLAIRSDKDRRWQAMPALLRNCPHLETLVIQGLVHHVTDKCGDVCDCISREDKGLSLKVCPVKVMEIYGFRGTMKEMAMIKHFLDYFPCLKEMEVYAEENNNPTQLGGNQRVLEMFKLYNKLSSCNVQLFI